VDAASVEHFVDEFGQVLGKIVARVDIDPVLFGKEGLLLVECRGSYFVGGTDARLIDADNQDFNIPFAVEELI